MVQKFKSVSLSWNFAPRLFRKNLFGILMLSGKSPSSLPVWTLEWILVSHHSHDGITYSIWFFYFCILFLSIFWFSYLLTKNLFCCEIILVFTYAFLYITHFFSANVRQIKKSYSNVDLLQFVAFIIFLCKYWKTFMIEIFSKRVTIPLNILFRNRVTYLKHQLPLVLSKLEAFMLNIFLTI